MDGSRAATDGETSRRGPDAEARPELSTP
jgi:hypothetical protein